MKTIFIDPTDVWLFRDGRPFAAGESHKAHSVFPPHPSVLYGALRTSGLVRAGVNPSQPFNDERFGSPASPGAFQLHGPIVHLNRRLAVPCPLDVVRIKESKILVRLSPLRGIGRASLQDLEPLHAAGRQEVEAAGGFLDARGLSEWLAGNVPEKTVASGNVFEIEERNGVALNDAAGRRPHDGHLYAAEFVRMKPGAGLAAWIEGDVGGLGEHGLFRLGGDGHAASYEIPADGPSLPPPPEAPQNGLAVLLLTPALFEAGEGTHSGPPDLSRFGAKPVAAAIGRSVPIGGWDVHRNRPKPILRAVPSGSVYFYRFEDAARFADAAREIHGACISDIMPEAGFGLAAVGGWNHVR